MTSATTVGADERIGVALLREGGGEAHVRAVLGEQQRRVGRQRVERVRDRRQRVVLDDDALDGVDGLRAGLRDDGRDDVADESHLVGREHRPVQRLGHRRELLQRRETEVVAARVVHGHDTRHRQRLGDVDRDQVGVRDRGPHERHVRHVRLDEVVDVLPRSGQERGIFETTDRIPEDRT